MPTKEYLAYKKEFWNCIAVSLIGLGIPLYYAFKYWKPLMNEERAKFAPKE